MKTEYKLYLMAGFVCTCFFSVGVAIYTHEKNYQQEKVARRIEADLKLKEEMKLNANCRNECRKLGRHFRKADNGTCECGRTREMCHIASENVLSCEIDLKK
jgi:hypothetical protein